MVALRCVFCGTELGSASCVWVRLPDGGDFVCCPSVCPPLLEAIETRRREVTMSRLQLRLPLSAA